MAQKSPTTSTETFLASGSESVSHSLDYIDIHSRGQLYHVKSRLFRRIDLYVRFASLRVSDVPFITHVYYAKCARFGELIRREKRGIPAREDHLDTDLPRLLEATSSQAVRCLEVKCSGRPGGLECARKSSEPVHTTRS